MQICSFLHCTGCMACYNQCYFGAINIEPDEEGFGRPNIDEEKCVQCGLCQKVCPANQSIKINSFPKQVYASWNTDAKKKKLSSSGGVFSALAETILEQGGKVYGAAFDKDFSVKHIAIDNVDDLWKLRGSKYVQSSINLMYRQVKNDLLGGYKVLFSGTPCQIDGLYSFLNDRFVGKLYTIDLVCHGVPSPRIWFDYLEYLKKKYKSPIMNVSFRDKSTSWHRYKLKVEFESSKTYIQDLFHDSYSCGFLRNYYLRPSCHCCRYANINRPADISLGDFWGYGSIDHQPQDDDTGISMIMINTSNGMLAFEEAKNHLVYYSRTIEQAKKGNQSLREPFLPASDRNDFWDSYRTKKFSYVVKKYLYPMDDSKPHGLLHRFKSIAYRILGKNIYNNIKQKIKSVLR